MKIDRLVWDDWNIVHIARHNVTLDEVEEACHNRHVSQESYQGRLILIAPANQGKMLAVILEPIEPGVYYPVTARPASRKERRFYHEQTQGGEQP